MAFRSFKEIVGEEFYQKAKDYAKIHSHPSDLRGFGLIAGNYLIIFTAILAHLYLEHFLIYLVAIVVIAGRQHGLLSLLHEAVHGLLFSRKSMNHLMANLFCILPLGNTFNTFARSHLNHHKFLNTKLDPEWYKKTTQGWKFRKNLKGFLYLAFMECLVRNLRGRALKFLNIFKGTENSRNHRWLFFAYYLILFGALIHFKLLGLFAIYWLVPYLLVLPLISFSRSLAEHFGLEYDSELSSSRNVRPSVLNQFFIPHDTGLHLTHHLFPGVPCYHLKKVTEFLEKSPRFREFAHRNDGYYLAENSVFKDVVRC